MSKAPAKNDGWFASMPTELPASLEKPTTMFSAKLMNFKKVSIIHDGLDYFFNVIRVVGVVGQNIDDVLINPVQVIIAIEPWRFLSIVLRNE